MSDVPLDPGGKSPNPDPPTGNEDSANSEPNSEQTSVSFDEHLKERSSKNSVSLKRNEIEKCITLLKHAMQCKKADCDKKSCAKQVFSYFQGSTDAKDDPFVREALQL